MHLMQVQLVGGESDQLRVIPTQGGGSCPRKSRNPAVQRGPKPLGPRLLGMDWDDLVCKAKPRGLEPASLMLRWAGFATPDSCANQEIVDNRAGGKGSHQHPRGQPSDRRVGHRHG